jgi:hypothetical protein
VDDKAATVSHTGRGPTVTSRRVVVVSCKLLSKRSRDESRPFTCNSLCRKPDRAENSPSLAHSLAAGSG